MPEVACFLPATSAVYLLSNVLLLP